MRVKIQTAKSFVTSRGARSESLGGFWRAINCSLAICVRPRRSRQIYREECITVEMATELRESFPDHVEITLFTSPEETRTGADWYWRFEKVGGAIHARVQAKRVQRTAFGQTDDLGHIKLDTQQLERLLDATQTAPPMIAGLQAWVATYARFEASPPCGSSNLQQCSHRYGRMPHILIAGGCHAQGGPHLVRRILACSQPA